MTDPRPAFPTDPRGHILAIVLMAGYALRSLNRMRRVIPGGLNGAHVLLDILLADREQRVGASLASTLAQVAVDANAGSRSILAISAGVGVPRESVRRILLALTAGGWLASLPQGGHATTERTRRGFALDDDAAALGEFIWIGQQVRSTLTAEGDELERMLARHPWHVALATERESVPHPPYAEAKGPLTARLRDATPADRECFANIVDGYLHRHMNRLRANFDGDLLLPVLIGEIAHRNIAMLAHHADATQEVQRIGATFADRDQWDRLTFAPINAHSLSQTMDIPDATVRRKIAYLLQRGWIAMAADGMLAVTPEVRLHSTPMNEASLADMMKTYGSLCALGIAA